MCEIAPRRRFVTADIDAAQATRLVTGLIVPRPIAWVGTRSGDGVGNLAPFSFFNAVGTTPPHLVVSMAVRDGRHKDSLRNVKATGVFTVSLVPHRLAGQMNTTSTVAPPEVDEFELAGVDAEEACLIDAPMVAGSPCSMECVADLIHPLGDADADHYELVVGRILMFHVMADLLDERGRVDQARIDTVARMGGPTYTTTRDRFDLERP